MHPVKLTNRQIQDMVEAIRQQLKGIKAASTSVKLDYKMKSIESEPATLVIEDMAWKKMQALIDQCSKEIAWHGTVTKAHNVYTITDVFVFPQMVTGATVTSDETTYSTWLMEQPDEVFNNLRFHGHSHVNMATNPSAVDLKYQDDVLKNLNDFYIFAIFNKRGSNWVTIIDVIDNIVYEDKDINLILPGEMEENWAKEQIAAKVVDTTAPKSKAKPAVTPPSEVSTYVSEFVDSIYDKSGKKKDTSDYKQSTISDYYGGYYGRSWYED